MQMTSNNRRVVALIDDDAAVCDSMRCLLEAYDLDVQTYQSGPDFLNEEEPGIDCLIVDCYMPGLDGLELGIRTAQAWQPGADHHDHHYHQFNGPATRGR